jgi:hypothetical protein
MIRTRIAVAVAAGVAAAAAVAAILAPAANSSVASAPPSIAPPVGVPGHWKLLANFNAKEMAGWRFTLFGDECVTHGGVQVTSANYLALTTSGAPGNCSQLASQERFAPAAGQTIVVQTRIKYPITDGKLPNWPAFWMTNPSWKTWPLYGEIDIAEALAATSDWPGGMCATFHWSTNGIPPGEANGWPRPGVGSTRSLCDVGAPSVGWHTYSAVWKVGSVAFYYDGHLLGTYFSPHILGDPLSIIYDNTTDWYGGKPSTVLVDYTRVWETIPLRTTTTLKLTYTKITYGSERGERLVVAVQAKRGTPAGTAVITAGSKTVCKLTLKNGTASCTLGRWELAGGSFKLRARFEGSDTYVVSASRAEWLHVSQKS